jgi:hypothetical protein
MAVVLSNVCGSTGPLVEEAAGADGFARALSTLMARADLRERLGQEARRHVAHWAPERIFAKWDDLLAEAVGSRWRVAWVLEATPGIEPGCTDLQSMRQIRSFNALAANWAR